MPSKKPIIHFNTEQWLIDKMKYIASENNRSLAKEMEYLCKERIKAYELENGEININEQKETLFQEKVEQMVDSLYDMLSTVAKIQKKPIREVWEEHLKTMSEKKKAKADFLLMKEYMERKLSEEE